MYVCVYVYLYTNIHTLYIRVCVYTHIHTYTYLPIYVSILLGMNTFFHIPILPSTRKDFNQIGWPLVPLTLSHRSKVS